MLIYSSEDNIYIKVLLSHLNQQAGKGENEALTVLWLENMHPFLGALVFGLFYGLTYCTSVCLPYVASYFAGIGGGFRKGIVVTSIYNSGRLVTYTLLGGLVGILKGFTTNFFSGSYQTYTLAIFGGVVVVIGLNILLRKEPSACVCANENSQPSDPSKLSSRFRANFDLRAFSMGFTRGFVVCPPLVALLLYSVASFSPIDCVVIAFLFGLGTAFAPLPVYIGVIGWILNKAPELRIWISRISGGILILLGISLIVSPLMVKSS